jgi:hypothetical protein
MYMYCNFCISYLFSWSLDDHVLRLHDSAGALTIRLPTNRHLDPNKVSTQNRLLWYFIFLAFWLELDGLYVHSKIRYSDLKFEWFVKVWHWPTVIMNPKGYNIFSLYFLSNIAVTFHPHVTNVHFLENCDISTHCYILSWCDNWSSRGCVWT